MIQPWCNEQPGFGILPFGGEPSIRDYLLPNILAFRATLSQDLQDKLQEIYLLRNETTDRYVNNKGINVFIRLNSSEADMKEQSMVITEMLTKFMSKLGLTVKVCIYNTDWLRLSSSRIFEEDLHNNSILVWSSSNDENFITAKSCIDYVYEFFVSHDIKEDLAMEDDALTDFILRVPLLDWANMQRAIHEAPIKYEGVPPYFYNIVREHISKWCIRYYLHMPQWACPFTGNHLVPKLVVENSN